MIKHLIPLFFLMLIPACSGHKGTGGLVTLSAAPVTVSPGTNAGLGIRIRVAGAYHFNPDFPSSVTIRNADGLVFEKQVWGSAVFRRKGNGALIQVPFTVPGNACKDQAVDIRVDCSICKAEECRIFKGLKIEIPVKCKKTR